MTSDVIGAALKEVQTSTQRLFQLINSIEIKHDSKTMEIKNLENRIEALKNTEKENSVKASAVLQQATEQAAEVQRQARQMMEEANRNREQAKLEREQADRKIIEAQNLMKSAEDKERSASAQWHQVNEKEKRLKAAMGV